MTRDEAIKVLKEYLELDKDIDSEYLEAQKVAIEVLEQTKWIPCSERLPERAEGGYSNWHTDPCIVCMYGKGIVDGYPDEEYYEILTGYFIEYEDEETGEKELAFTPDRFPLFVPDGLYTYIFDKDFKSHFSKEECEYYTDDSWTKTEFKDRYYQVLAWMPLPEPYVTETNVEENGECRK